MRLYASESDDGVRPEVETPMPSVIIRRWCVRSIAPSFLRAS